MAVFNIWVLGGSAPFRVDKDLWEIMYLVAGTQYLSEF